AAIAYAFWVGRERARAYMGLMLFLTGAIVGVFAAQDLLLFSAFFEAMLIPLYVLVGVWGGPGRLGATLKFVLFTMAGSLLMLASIVVYGLSQNTFDLVQIGQSTSDWVFLGFVAAFAIKAPLFPLHGWLPDAYRESSPEVAAVLSGVVSKAAAYGFLRIAVAKFPQPAHDFRVPILALAAIGLIYGSLLAFPGLHQGCGPAVSDSALSLRPAELGVTAPLVACLLALSIWPAAITQHSFRDDHGAADVAAQFK